MIKIETLNEREQLISQNLEEQKKLRLQVHQKLNETDAVILQLQGHLNEIQILKNMSAGESKDVSEENGVD